MTSHDGFERNVLLASSSFRVGLALSMKLELFYL